MTRKYFKIFVLFLCLYFGLVMLKIFVADIYLIRGSSMENTLTAGSHVLVLKYIYGAKLPQSTWEIPYSSWFFKMFQKYSLWADTRVPGVGRIGRGDICIAKFRSVQQVKRIVAIPGDTLKIENGFVTVNSMPEEILLTYKLIYTCHIDSINVEQLKSKYKIVYNGLNNFDLYFTGQSLLDFQRQYSFSLKAKLLPRDTVKAKGIFP